MTEVIRCTIVLFVMLGLMYPVLFLINYNLPKTRERRSRILVNEARARELDIRAESHRLAPQINQAEIAKRNNQVVVLDLEIEKRKLELEALEHEMQKYRGTFDPKDYP